MKSILTNILTFVSAIFFIGCGGSGVDSQNYQDPVFDSYTIKTIAVLPIRNSNLNIGEAKEINRYFMTGLDRKNKKYKIIGPDESIQKLNNDDLVEKYYNSLVSYSTTGISNTETMKEIGISLSCDAIVQGEIYDIIKRDGEFGNHRGETRCKIRYSLISTKDGKTLWETTAESHEKTSTTLSDAPALMGVLLNGMDKILESIPNQK